MTDSNLPPLLRPTRIQTGLWIILVAVMLVIIAANVGAPVALSVDGSHYVVLAESLSTGKAYGLVSRAPAPENTGLVISPFPWGYPLLLAPLAAFFPGQFHLFGLPSLLATLANATLLFWGWRLLGRGSYWWGLAVAGLHCLSPLTINLADRVFSEAVFTTFLLASTLMIEYGVRHLSGRLPVWWHPLTGGLLAMMVFTRTAGWAMLAGLGGYVLIKHRRAGLRQLLFVAAWMAVWTALVVLLTPVAGRDLLPTSYARQWQGIVEGNNRALRDQGLSYPQALLNLAGRRLYRDIPSAIAPGIASQYTAIRLARLGLDPYLPHLGWAISFLLFLGFLRWGRREGATAFLLTAAPYLLLLLGWRALGPRLLYPVQAQLFYALLFAVDVVLLGLGAAGGLWRQLLVRRRILAVAAGSLLVVYTVISILNPGDASYAQALADRGRWFLTNTPPSAIVMSLRPELDYLYGHRQGLPHSNNIDAYSPAQLAAKLEAAAVDYLVVEKQTGAWNLANDGSTLQRSFRNDDAIDHLSEIARALAADGWLELRHSDPDGFFVIYQVQK